MPVITISRQYASGGSTVARFVADRLGWQLVDNEFVYRVAREAGVSRKEVEEHEERVPGLIDRLARALVASAPEAFVASAEPPESGFATEEELVRATETVIEQALREEKNLVLVGRGAQALLAQHEQSLHVFIVAPREHRIEAATKRLGADRETAEETLDRTDDGRRRYVKTYYGREWEAADNYHLVISTGVFSHEQAAEMVVGAVGLRGWRIGG
jgi:cytidylate kinase